MARKTDQKVRDYKIAFGTPEGERVLHDIVANCFVLQSTLAETPEATAFNEGMRNSALRILSVLHYQPQDFLRLPEKVENDE
jgi:hypothetical protein